MTELTKTAFAKHLGLSPSRISQYIRAGMPTRWNGLVNIADGERWIRRRIRTARNKWSDRGRLRLYASDYPDDA
jgi:predicted transcriptional regulator